MKIIYKLLYYTLFQFWPMAPFPTYKFGYKVRHFLAKRLLKNCSNGVIIKDRAYFGNGDRLSVGMNSQLGQNCRLNGDIEIGDNVLMGPDVVMMATSHEYSNTEIPMMDQGEAIVKKIIIGNDVWIGTRVIILPGVEVGDKSIIGAGSVVAKSVPKGSVVVGNPGKIVKNRLKLRDNE